MALGRFAMPTRVVDHFQSNQFPEMRVSRQLDAAAQVPVGT